MIVKTMENFRHVCAKSRAKAHTSAIPGRDDLETNNSTKENLFEELRKA